jgi:hypothetical protein
MMMMMMMSFLEPELTHKTRVMNNNKKLVKFNSLLN